MTHGFPIAALVDDQPPEPDRWRGGTEVLEIEREDGQIGSFGQGHHGRVREAEIEGGKARVDLHRTTQKACRRRRRGVHPRSHRRQERSCGGGAHSGAEQLIRLDDHGCRHKQVAAQEGNEVGGQLMSSISPIGGRDQWARVSDDPHDSAGD